MDKAKNRNIAERFLENGKAFPILGGIASGLYPIFFYYSNNFPLVNTWTHLGYFILMFLIVPIAIFLFAKSISRFSFVINFKNQLYTFLSIFIFLYLLKVCLYPQVERKIILGIFIISLLAAYFLKNHQRKIILFQLFLSFVALFSLVPTLIKNLNYSDDWLSQPDAIENIVFTKRPNVYYIQPDGYTNFSELGKGYYQVENSSFQAFLKMENFKHYPNFRSNYFSTLSSNSSLFNMKHHYYLGNENSGEITNGRSLIVSENVVLNIFKKNNYRTYYITEKPYLLINRPKIGFDVCNYNLDEIPYLNTGLNEKKDVNEPLEDFIKEKPEQSKFFFIEFLLPSHITHSKKPNSESASIERTVWLKNLNLANQKLGAIISNIKRNDPNALIFIMADHGGFVGFDFSSQAYTKTDDRNLIYSIFSSELAIHWPHGEVPPYDNLLKTNVNVFRVIFSYLSENKSYLQYLEKDESYIPIKEGAPKGVYEYIDVNGNITFKKH